MAGAVAGEIDEDVDPVGPYLCCQGFVRQMPDGPPEIGSPPERLGHLVLDRDAGIADDLERQTIVATKHRTENGGS